VAAGVAGGMVLALLAAAQRSDTAYQRFRAAGNTAHAYVDPGIAFGDDTLDLRRVARLPQVAQVEYSELLAVIAKTRSGRSVYPAGPDGIQFNLSTDGRARDRIDVPMLLRGRLPDPRRPDEALADSRAARVLGLDLGGVLTMRVISRDRLVNHLDETRLTADPMTAHVGPLARVRIVGIAANGRTSVDAAQVHLSSGFYGAHGGPALGAFVRELETRLVHGAADIKAFKAGVQRIAGRHPYGFFEGSGSRIETPRSLVLLAQALRILAALVGGALLLLLAQAVVRQAVFDSGGQATLRALGMTRRQLLGLAAARTGVVAVTAATVAGLIALAVSPLTPFGWARELETDPGLAFDSGRIIPGAAAVLGVIMVVGLLAGGWTVRTGETDGRGARARRTRPPGARFGALARAGLPPALWTGLRTVTFGRGGTTRAPVRSTFVAAVVAVGVAVTALIFPASLQHLLDTPRLYGQTWDFEMSAGGPPFDAAFVAKLVGDRAFAGVGTGALVPVEVNGRTTSALAKDDVKGSVALTVLEGRAPGAPDEILLGRRTADDLHVHVGDRVAVSTGTGSARLRLVGLGVLPTNQWAKLGEGASMPFRAFRRIQPELKANAGWVTLAPDADRTAALARLRGLADGPSSAVVPADLADFGGVADMPALIAGVLTLAATAALAHALLTSIRRRRADIAVLKTIGFTRAQVVQTVAAQASVIAAVGLLAGIPLGVGVARFTWNVFARDLGVVPEAIIPFGPTALVIPAALLLANLVAAAPALSAARTRPAAVLQAE
jgi:hypothetical protein